MDAPSIVRGVATGFLARPTSKASIGKVFQDRAEKYADRPFIKFGDRSLTYAQANATANRYAAVLAERGVTHGDVVGIMLRNSPNAVLMMLATVKCGAVAGMLNYHQRGDVLSHSIGLLDAKLLVAEAISSRTSRKAALTGPASGDHRGVREPGRVGVHRQSGVGVRRCRRRTPRSTSSPRAPPGIPRPA